jgi:predicted TIM-barrel fold metal-dependent hydrolase
MTGVATKFLYTLALVAVVLLPACASCANTPTVHTQALGEYLKDLFESHEIILDESDFLGPVEEPYLAFAKMLNLIPSSAQGDKEITDETAGQISEQFLSIKDYILLDGLYGKIDMHEHYRDGGDVEEFLKAAGCLGISKVVFLPTGLGPDNEGYEQHQESLIKHIKKEYPDKVIAFCTIDEADPRAAEIFEQCLKDGADGLKLIGGHPNFYDEPLNSENMYKVYQKASEYGVPVLLHGSIMNIKGLKEQLEQVYADFPEVTFIHAHYCSTIMSGIHLDQCAELLDKYPNLYIDLSMGGGIERYHGYFRLDISLITDFIVTYQDRILFGSDIILDTSKYKDFDWLYKRIKCDIDLHQQEYYECSFGEEENPKPGFCLDEEVLRKLYYDNPRKVLGY